jgi:hypothetical protein
MGVQNNSTSGTDPRRLARLLGVGAEDHQVGQGELSNQDTANLLHARLGQPLPMDGAVVDSLPAVLGRPCEELVPLAGRTLGEVLQDAEVGPAVNEVIKEYGKGLGARWPAGPEHAISVTIYYAGIASALVFHDRKITAHSYMKLETAFSKLMEKPWMDADLARLFARARNVCSGREK